MNQRNRSSRTVSICLIFVVALAAAIMASCATPMAAYSGPRQPPEKIALIRCTTHMGVFHANSVNITAVDGVALEARKIDVLPGEHELDIQCSGTVGNVFFWRSDGTVTLTVEAGKRYAIQYSRRSERVYIWIVDEISGEIVGGEKKGEGFPIEKITL